MSSQNAFALALKYEESVTAEQAKREGIYYTPSSIVSFMLRRSQELVSNGDVLRILDPSCGGGIFLLHAFLEHMKGLSSDQDAFAQASSFITQSLFGVDKDGDAVRVCKNGISHLFEDVVGQKVSQSITDALSRNILQGNSLIEHLDIPGLFKNKFSPLSWKQSFPDVFSGSNGGFDLIIGNPPYGLSRDGQLELEERELLKKLFYEHIDGKPNKYLLFITKSFSLLRNGGVLSFIVPNAWLGIRGGRKIRRAFLREGSLVEIVRFEGDVFGDPGVEPVVFFVQKGVRRDNITVTNFNVATNATATAFRVSTSECLADEDATIPLQWHNDVEKVFSFLRTETFSLESEDSPFIPMIAIQAYKEGGGTPPQSKAQVKAHVFHSASKQGTESVRYLEGKDVSRFKISWSGSYLTYGPWLAECPPLSRFSGPRVLIREIVAPLPNLLQAAFVEDVYVYNRSILHIVPKGSVADSRSIMLALLAILNSKLATFILRFKGRKTQRKLFPKIVNDDLKCFPLPRTFMQLVEDLKQAAQLGTNSPSSMEIDSAVYKAYGLSDPFIEIIEKHTTALCDH